MDRRATSAWWVAAGLAGALVLAACSAGPAPDAQTGGPTPGTTGRATAPTAPATSPPPPVPAAPAAPAAPTITDVSASRPVAPPPGTPNATIRRDCGMTAPLSNGRTLWIYCDTALFGTDQRLVSFVNTSAAVASADAPAVMQDQLDADGHPRTFLKVDGDYPACEAAEKQSLWPQSAVTVPASGTETSDRVLIWYSNVCLVPNGAETFDIGLAEATYATGSAASTAPASVRILSSRVLPKLGKAGGYGVASVLEGPDAYLYWCGQDSEPCTIAKVPVAAAADRDAYRYWDGSGWAADAGAARPLVMGASQPRIKASVRWVPALERYVMVDVDSFSILNVRLAARPEGPWTAPAWVHLPECSRPYPDNCFAAEIQPQLSGPGHVAVSYFDPAQPYGVAPTTRVVDVGVTPAP